MAITKEELARKLREERLAQEQRLGRSGRPVFPIFRKTLDESPSIKYALTPATTEERVAAADPARRALIEERARLQQQPAVQTPTQPGLSPGLRARQGYEEGFQETFGPAIRGVVSSVGAAGAVVKPVKEFVFGAGGETDSGIVRAVERPDIGARDEIRKQVAASPQQAPVARPATVSEPRQLGKDEIVGSLRPGDYGGDPQNPITVRNESGVQVIRGPASSRPQANLPYLAEPTEPGPNAGAEEHANYRQQLATAAQTNIERAQQLGAAQAPRVARTGATDTPLDAARYALDVQEFGAKRGDARAEQIAEAADFVPPAIQEAFVLEAERNPDIPVRLLAQRLSVEYQNAVDSAGSGYNPFSNRQPFQLQDFVGGTIPSLVEGLRRDLQR